MVTTVIEQALNGRQQISSTQVSSSSTANGLNAVRDRIAQLRVRSSASKRTSSAIADSAGMVPVFQTPVAELETLVPDRDAVKREERIRALLAERGNMRLLGAQAGPALSASIEALAESHPNFSAAVEFVLGEEALARRTGSALTGLRLLLTGGPGVGKTDFSMRLAEKLGVPSQVISMSSSQASAALAGSENYWGNTKPGLVWEGLIQGDFANPLFILDEVEKAPGNWGDPVGALYQLAESKTAREFRDKSVPWLPIDASHVNWIATANDAGRLNEALRSRFMEIEVGAPSEASLRSLVQRLYVGMLTEFQLCDRFPAQLSDVSEDALIAGSVRDAKRILRAAIARALRLEHTEVVIEMETRAGRDFRIGFI